MPCPPHPLELREMSLSRQCSVVRTKALAIRATLTFFEKIAPTIDLTQLKTLNQELYRQLQTKVFTKKNPNRQYPIPKHLNLKPAFDLKDSLQVMTTADKLMDDFEKKISKLYSKYEVDLCIFRDLLMKVEPFLIAQKLSKEDQDKLKNEKKAHLKHRKEDQAAKIKQLQANIKKLKNRNSQRTINPKIEALKDQIARIKSFSDEELLSDRNLF